MQTLILLLLVIVPITNLLHELGHIVMARLLKADHAILELGMGSELLSFSCFNTHIKIRTIFFVGAMSTNESDIELSYLKKALIAIGGPLSNTILVLCLIQFDPFSQLFHLMVLFNIWVALFNLIPFKLGQKRSDGYQFIQMLFYAITKRQTIR